MRELAEKDRRVLKEPRVDTFVDELADSAVVLTLWYWTASADFWPTSRDMIKSVKQAFDENGISIPFPQVTYNARVPGLAQPTARAEPEDA
ncbi:Small-conductance mechanosensitive channel [compost metagenome]